MTNKVKTQKENDPTTWPEHWFIQLMRSDRAGDFDSAARAQKELKKLGWNVKKEEVES